MASIGTAAIAGPLAGASAQGVARESKGGPDKTSKLLQEQPLWLWRKSDVSEVSRSSARVRPAKPSWPRRCCLPPARLTRQGRPDDGTAAMDFEPEELHRKVSISSAFHHLQLEKGRGHRRRYCPATSAFLPDTFATMRAVDGVVFAGDGRRRPEGRIGKNLGGDERLGLPRIAFVSRLDRERTSFDARDGGPRESARRHPVALTLPIGAELTFNGVIDVLAMKALIYSDTSGKPREEALNARAEGTRGNARARDCARPSPRPTTRCSRNISTRAVLEDDDCAPRCAPPPSPAR